MRIALLAFHLRLNSTCPDQLQEYNNRPWLVGYFQTLKALNPDPQARLHLDSNGTLLTPDYVDEFVLEAGVTDIGIEPKAVQVATFQRITGIADAALAERYLETAWQAVEYVAATYAERVLLEVGMPCNRELVGGNSKV